MIIYVGFQTDLLVLTIKPAEISEDRTTSDSVTAIFRFDTVPNQSSQKQAVFMPNERQYYIKTRITFINMKGPEVIPNGRTENLKYR